MSYQGAFFCVRCHILVAGSSADRKISIGLPSLWQGVCIGAYRVHSVQTATYWSAYAGFL